MNTFLPTSSAEETLTIVFAGFIVLVAMSLLFFFLYRNARVYRLRIRINQLCFDWSMRHLQDLVDGTETSAYLWAYELLPPYDSMVFSVKPLTIETWLPKDVVDKLNR